MCCSSRRSGSSRRGCRRGQAACIGRGIGFGKIKYFVFLSGAKIFPPFFSLSSFRGRAIVHALLRGLEIRPGRAFIIIFQFSPPPPFPCFWKARKGRWNTCTFANNGLGFGEPLDRVLFRVPSYMGKRPRILTIFFIYFQKERSNKRARSSLGIPGMEQEIAQTFLLSVARGKKGLSESHIPRICHLLE